MERRDDGSTSAEYPGIVVVVAIVIASLAAVTTSTDLGRHLVDRVQCIVSASSCAGAGGHTASVPGGSTDRRDAGRDARGDRRDDARRDDDDSPQQPGAPGDGGAAGTDPIGAPVPGTGPLSPATQPWTPVDAGAGEYDSTDPSLGDRAAEVAAEAGAHALAGTWPAASRNLLHFLGGSGEPLEQDVETMLNDVPEFRDVVASDQTRLAETAVDRARAAGINEPVTYPVSTAWQGFGYDANGALVYDNQNYFYALGGWQNSQTGYITVYPPAEPGGEWTYKGSLTTNIRDQYNWDGGKQTSIGSITVTDEQLAELHRAGLAQEFTAYGSSDPTQLEGSVP